jgi:hypothetical protein
LEKATTAVSEKNAELKKMEQRLNMVNLARSQSDFDKIFEEGEAEALLKQFE